MSTAEGRTVEVNGISLYVEDHGSGTPVLLIHGWPDSSYLWRHQIPFLTGHGFRAIAPDMRGFGRSGRPPSVSDYALANAVGDMTGILDALGAESAHVVGHDWGAVVAWLLATFHPGRVKKLVVLSVAHPRAPRTFRQDEMAWYQLFFQFEGIAEATLAHDDWAWLRRFSRGDGDQERYVRDLSRPGALTASLNWYRANLAPRMPGPAPDRRKTRFAIRRCTTRSLPLSPTATTHRAGSRATSAGSQMRSPIRCTCLRTAGSSSENPTCCDRDGRGTASPSRSSPSTRRS